ncbi:MAG TPA: hypothetical protein VJH97_03715 [Candidatus Nanoarchaeia archaeon]|nr:hypothetical protein [Candidatus Nanoarchaeia archaeon]
MKLRRRTIGDLYLAASILFIFLSFVYSGAFERYDFAFAFLVIGLLVALFGAITKRKLIQQEHSRKRKK